MSPRLTLRITTPMEALVPGAEALSVRAEDETGGFGILPGHVDFLTMLPASVVRWREAGGGQRFCAVRAGILTVTGGAEVAISCREGVLGADLDSLREEVGRLRAAQIEADRNARVETTRLHSRAVRQIMHYLRPDRPGAFTPPPRISPPEGGKP